MAIAARQIETAGYASVADANVFTIQRGLMLPKGAEQLGCSSAPLPDLRERVFSRLAAQSSDQFARSFGISGEDGQKAIRTSSANVEALLETANVLTSASEELADG